MGTPEEKARRRMRIRSHVAKDLGTTKFRQRVKESERKKKPKDVTKLSHAEFVQLIQDLDETKNVT